MILTWVKELLRVLDEFYVEMAAKKIDASVNNARYEGLGQFLSM